MQVHSCQAARNFRSGRFLSTSTRNRACLLGARWTVVSAIKCYKVLNITTTLKHFWALHVYYLSAVFHQTLVLSKAGVCLWLLSCNGRKIVLVSGVRCTLSWVIAISFLWQGPRSWEFGLYLSKLGNTILPPSRIQLSALNFHTSQFQLLIP